MFLSNVGDYICLLIAPGDPSEVYDEAALEKTMKALEFNPEYATFWNFRREILLHFMSAGADRKKLLDKELIFLERALSKVTHISRRLSCCFFIGVA